MVFSEQIFYVKDVFVVIAFNLFLFLILVRVFTLDAFVPLD